MNKNILCLLVLIVTWGACQQDEMANKKTGYLQFSVDKNASTIPMPLTRADEIPIALQLVNKAGVIVKETDDWHNWATQPVELDAGNYVVKAFSKEVNGEMARFDTPYYVGETEVSVVAEANQTVNIECTLADVKVSVKYSDDVKTYFSKLACTVKNSSGSLTFGRDETRSGYLVAADLNLSLALMNLNGKSYTLQSTVTDVQVRQHYHINYSMKTSGSVNDITVSLDPSTKEYNVDIKIPKESSPSVNAWSTFADVSLGVTDVVKTKECKYRLHSAEEWNVIPDEMVTLTDGKLVARILDLTPSTEYDFCFAVNGMDGKITTATTETELLLTNGYFDNWNQNGKIWFPGTPEEASSKNSYWDTGNVGAATMSKNPTQGEGNDVHTSGGKSVKMESQFVGMFGQGKFAAGNIYIGHYCDTYTSLSNMGARIRFGRPFVSRPVQLKGWYKYSRGTDVNYGSTGKDELTASGGDKCAIYIALTDNAGLTGADFGNTAYEIDNHATDQPDKYIYKSTLDLSEKNKDVIAYGSITDEESKGAFDENGAIVWKEFTIDLKYRDLTRKPKYIIVVASASKYGDFFTGSTGSVLYIDDFELIYGIPVTTN